MPPLRAPSSTAEVVAFVVFAAVALMGAVATISLRNPIRCAVGLFFHILALAGLYLTLGAHFLGAIQLLVYAGAVVVLFVFVIMLLGPDANPAHDQRGVGVRVVSGVAVALGVLAVLTTVMFLRPAQVLRPEGYGSLKQVGLYVFNQAVVPMELLGITLVVAVVGAFAVARGHHKKRAHLADPDPSTPGVNLAERTRAAAASPSSAEEHS
jgi:NADH-quinone oxidoreductase subunit J